jgi:uncharacterized protein
VNRTERGKKMSFTEKLAPTPRKRLLALDGGGIRGVITLEVLARIEAILRELTGGDSKFRLANYFDYIGGTSTGALIASGLSLGMSVSAIRDFYHSSAKSMFSRAEYLRRFRYKYVDRNLSALLQQIFGTETTLGSERLLTLLMLVMRNATTDSPWPITNNPYAKFNDRQRTDCNLQLPLWQLIRASTAAPIYFPPEIVHIGDQTFLFVDGGITTYNNPAFQLFLMATLDSYRLRWPTGADKLLLVSIGTGTTPTVRSSLKAEDMNLLYNIECVPSAVMLAALNEQDFLCRVFGDCLAGPALDSEVDDLIGVNSPAGTNLFTYLRYNTELSTESLRSLGLDGVRPEDVQCLDSVDHIPELQQIGQAVAEQQIKEQHFHRFESFS